MSQEQEIVTRQIGRAIAYVLVFVVPVIWAAWRAKHPRKDRPSLAYRLGRLLGGLTSGSPRENHDRTETSRVATLRTHSSPVEAAMPPSGDAQTQVFRVKCPNCTDADAEVQRFFDSPEAAHAAHAATCRPRPTRPQTIARVLVLTCWIGLGSILAIGVVSRWQRDVGEYRIVYTDEKYRPVAEERTVFANKKECESALHDHSTGRPYLQDIPGRPYFAAGCVPNKRPYPNELSARERHH